jgi:hypothetical protein
MAKKKPKKTLQKSIEELTEEVRRLREENSKQGPTYSGNCIDFGYWSCGHPKSYPDSEFCGICAAISGYS